MRVLPLTTSTAAGRRHATIGDTLQERVDVAPPALARNVRVVRGGEQADRLRRPRVEVAARVRALLERVRAELVLVVQNVVVSGA